MNRIIWYISGIILVLSGLVNAQTYPFRTYSIQDGLSESVVNDIIQDSDGYIWMGTGYGLNRFDGIEFDSFFEESGLNSGKIYSLFESKDGKIWIGSASGVNVMEGDSIYSIPALSALTSSTVISIFEDSEGMMWFGTDGDGVWQYFGDDRIIQYSTAQGLKSNDVRAIVESGNGDLWFATRGGLTRLSNGNFRTFTTDDGLPADRTRDVLINKYGLLWIATRNGLSSFDGDRFQIYSTELGLGDPKIQEIALADDGTIWLATEAGVSEFNGKSFRNYTVEQGLANNIVHSTTIDREGNVWFGTFGGGASLFLGSYFENFTTESGLSDNLITSISEDGAGNLWLASYGGGLMKRTENGFEYMGQEDGLLDDRIYHISTDSRGRMWVGMRDGLSYMEEGRLTTFSDDEFPFRKVRHVFEASNGDYWISTMDDGLVQLSDNQYSVYNEENGLPGNQIRGATEDNEGNIWVASYAGVVKITKDGIETFSIQDGVPHNSVTMIITDRNGTIWISTFNGIAWYDGVQFVDINEEDGLPGRVCYFISQHSDGSLWVGTNDGVAWLDVEKFYSNDSELREQSIQILNREQGLVTNEMNLGAVHEDSNGHYWFGGVEGVSHFNPEAYPGNKIPPKIHILDFIASGESHETYGLELPHNSNFVEIHFAGLNFTSPNQVTYEYMMNGIDPGWQRTTSRSARYPSLPPGEYYFRVHARNSNGIWSEDISIIRFTVTPPFWMSWWFIALVIASIVGIIYLFYRNYQVMKMVDIERMRVRIASDLHDDVGASLTEIALQSDFLQASNTDSEFKQSLNQIGKQCRHVVTSLDDIVWSIDARNDTLGDLTDRMQDYIINVLEPKNFKVSYDFEELKMDNKLPVPVKENVYLIFKEAVNNIAKYSNGDEVKVSMESDGEKYKFEVYDNGTSGKGLKKTGHGLRNMEMRAQRTGGNFHFNDEDGFTITLEGRLNVNQTR